MPLDDLGKITFFCADASRETTGIGYRRLFSSSERVARAIKVGGVWVIVILLSALVPILHFVLVPLFLLLSLFFTYATYMEQGQLVKGEFNCPNCQRLNHLSDESDDWPKERRCSDCGSLLKLSNLPMVNRHEAQH